MVKTIFTITVTAFFGSSCAPKNAVERYVPPLPEAVVQAKTLPTGHVVGIGHELAKGGEALVSEACAQIDGYLSKHQCPATTVRFYVMKYPVALPIPGRPTQCVRSYRVPPSGPIVLGWWFDGEGRFVVGDIDWEVSRFVRGVDDYDRSVF